MRNRTTRLAIDVVFLVLSLVFIVQDATSGDRLGLVFWGLSLVLWVVALIGDSRRPVDSQNRIVPRSSL